MASPYVTSYMGPNALYITPDPMFMSGPTIGGSTLAPSSLGLGSTTDDSSSHLDGAGTPCVRLKGSQSWGVLMAFLESTMRHPFFDTGGDLLSHFCVPNIGLPYESRPQSPTLPSQVRNHRFKEGIETHLLAPLCPTSVYCLEDAIVKGVRSATKVMLSIGALRSLRHVEEYLLSLDQVCSRPCSVGHATCWLTV